MAQVEFEPTIPVFEWAKTDRAATVISIIPTDKHNSCNVVMFLTSRPIKLFAHLLKQLLIIAFKCVNLSVLSNARNFLWQCQSCPLIR
jgi:hypothetical protein